MGGFTLATGARGATVWLKENVDSGSRAGEVSLAPGWVHVEDGEFWFSYPSEVVAFVEWFSE